MTGEISKTPRCDDFRALLPELVDGSPLSDEQATFAGVHRAECVNCNALLVDLRAIRSAAQALPEVAPLRDLWAGIAERIEAPVLPLASDAAIAGRGSAESARRQRSIRVAAAAVLLVALSSGLTFWFTRLLDDPPATLGSNNNSLVDERSRPALANDGAVYPGDSNVTLVTALETVQHSYQEEMQKLQAVLATRRSSLDPATLAVLDENLAIIEEAINRSFDALLQDPENSLLVDLYSRALTSKAGLLRQAVLLQPATNFQEDQ